MNWNVEGRLRIVLVVFIGALVAVSGILIALANTGPSRANCTGHCGAPPVPPFFVGNVTGPTLCAGWGTPQLGCFGVDHHIFALEIVQSSIEFGQVLFKIENPNGSVFTASSSCAFSIFNLTGSPEAVFYLSGGPLEMTNQSGWAYTGTTGVSATTPLGVQYAIVIDVGTVLPVLGASFSFTGNNTTIPFTGSITLP